MSKSFSDFEYENPHQENMQDAVKQTYDELKDLDQTTLQQKLIEEVNKQKANNTFNFALLSSTVESMKPFMPQETYDGLKNLLERIK